MKQKRRNNPERFKKIILAEKIRQATEESKLGVTVQNIREKAMKISKYDNDNLYVTIYNILYDGLGDEAFN